MIERVNPSHPDKVADRIAGAMVDLAYKKQVNPRIAVEVLIGHRHCLIIAETSVHFENNEVHDIVYRMLDTADCVLSYVEVAQNVYLAENQKDGLRCGDNGIFVGKPFNPEEIALYRLSKRLYDKWPSDGKYIYSQLDNKVIVCQSNADSNEIEQVVRETMGSPINIIINPLGDWTGGTNVDTGATNRKLGSDMGRAVTGGGLHGKDLSKADVSINIVCHLMASALHEEVKAYCAIGDDTVKFRSESLETELDYGTVVDRAHEYINEIGGFEKFAEWGFALHI